MLCLVVFFFMACGTPQAAVSGYPAPPSLADLADAVKHSVVNVSTTQVVKGQQGMPFFGPNSPFGEFFGRNMPQGEMKTHALGSGVVIDKNGLIFTNNHVVEKATEIKIKLDNGREYDAKVVGKDPKTDLALIQVKPDDAFPAAVRLGDSDAIRVGDWVIAVGNPFGLEHTVTEGIISATGRVIGAGPYDDFLQTDAAINPGNSGGPLFNMKGEVIGINTAIIPQGQGIGFAIPINIAKELLPQLKTGKIVRGWLGVVIQDVTPALAKSFGLEKPEGILISEVVKDSPAEKAGLKSGDVLLRFDGKKIENAHVLSRIVANTPPDTQVVLDIMRDGKEQKVHLTIGTMQGNEEAQVPEENSSLGLSVQDLTPELAERLGLNPTEQGVVVSQVTPGSSADDAGIQPGDVIKQVNRINIRNVNEYNKAVAAAGKGENLLLLVRRNGGNFFVVLNPASKE